MVDGTKEINYDHHPLFFEAINVDWFFIHWITFHHPAPQKKIIYGFDWNLLGVRTFKHSQRKRIRTILFIRNKNTNKNQGKYNLPIELMHLH